MARLRGAGCVFAEEEAALLLAEAEGSDRLEELLAAREAGTPLEHLLGWAAFCGRRVEVEPGVFVPRQRTALLVREAAALVHRSSVVVDLCCGSGAVGRAVAALAPPAVLHAADVDPVAVRCARRTLHDVGGVVHEGDLYDALPGSLRGRVDVLVVNAPYVPSDALRLLPPEARLHEPRAALDGGADGTALQARVAAGASAWLAPGGALLVETSEEQAAATLALVVAAGLAPDVRVPADPEDGTRVVLGRRR